MEKYIVTGVMSGTSLDGVDIATVEFFLLESGQITYNWLATDFYPYHKRWTDTLQNIRELSGRDLFLADVGLGRYFGELINQHKHQHGLSPLAIASHGHTVFHQPENQLTLQIGCGQAIHEATRIRTVYDFRRMHVLSGGQGAPLVPIGDRMLFPEYAACVNLGGFANLSFDQDGKRHAQDICPVNILLNRYSRLLGKPFDDGGNLGKMGEVHEEMLKRMTDIQPMGHSLGVEMLDSLFVLLDALAPLDALATSYAYIDMILSSRLNILPDGEILLTGGGAKNKWLTDTLISSCKHKIVLPDSKLIDFKEALIFALLGMLRIKNEINILGSASGNIDLCGGMIAENYTLE